MQNATERLRAPPPPHSGRCTTTLPSNPASLTVSPRLVKSRVGNVVCSTYGCCASPGRELCVHHPRVSTVSGRDWGEESRAPLDVLANIPDRVRVIERRDHPVSAPPSKPPSAFKTSGCERETPHLSPVRRRICSCVVGSFRSTSNSTTPPAELAPALAEEAGIVPGIDCARFPPPPADSGNGDAAPRRFPDPEKGPCGGGGWRVHCSERRSAIRSSTGWSCFTLSIEIGARLQAGERAGGQFRFRVP